MKIFLISFLNFISFYQYLEIYCFPRLINFFFFCSSVSDGIGIFLKNFILILSSFFKSFLQNKKIIIYFLMVRCFLNIMNHFFIVLWLARYCSKLKKLITFLPKFIPVASTDFDSISYIILNNIKILLANVVLIFSLITVSLFKISVLFLHRFSLQ